jgi:O-antigen ligase
MKYSRSPWIGFGPGMYASNIAFQLMPATNNLVYDAFNQTKYGMDPDVDSQIIPIWGEFGYAGVIVFLGFIIFCFFYFYIEYRHARDMQLKAFSFVSMTGTVFLLFGFYVAHVWETQTVFGTLMMFYGLFYLRRKEIRAQVSSGVKQREII